jgi:UMP-CMP kinase
MAAAPATALPDPTIQPDPPIASANISPAFDPKSVTVVYILGGPGSGKGTQSAHLVEHYGFTHLSAGDLLREEQDREGSEYGELIKSYIKEGLIVPMEVTVKLLENAMRAKLDEQGTGRFLVDGFPRKMDQAAFFEQAVCPSRCTVFLDCPEEVMRKRLLHRGLTSGRADDNEESIVKRFRTFVETSMPVVTHFEAEDRVVKVDADKEETEVYGDIVKGLAQKDIHPIK